MLVVRGYSHAGSFGVGVEISGGGEVGVDADDFVECLPERECEEADAGIEIKSDIALRAGSHRVKKIFDQETVRLEKREVADAEFESAGFVHQVAGAGEFEAIFALVEEQQAFELGNSVSKDRGDFGGGCGKALERDVQRNLFIFRIDEGFDLLEFFRDVAGAGEILELFERFVKRGRKNWAGVDRQNHRAFGQKVSECHWFGVAERPLSAIPVAEGFGGVNLDRPIQLNAAETRKSLAQNGFFEFDLGRSWDVLIVAAAAGAEVRAGRFLATRIGFCDFVELAPDQLVAFCLDGCARFFASL